MELIKNQIDRHRRKFNGYYGFDYDYVFDGYVVTISRFKDEVASIYSNEEKSLIKSFSNFSTAPCVHLCMYNLDIRTIEKELDRCSYEFSDYFGTGAADAILTHESDGDVDF